MINQILMAAARGAVIETHYQYPKKHWGVVSGIRTDDTYEYRIKKGFKHLRFGPISTALREAAEQTNMSIAWSCKGFMEVGAVCEYTTETRNQDWEDCWSELHRSLFLLILSEALTEEGL